MLAIRMQRTGRKGHAQFRVVVQDSHQSPKSGKFIAHLGSYDPHTKAIKLEKEKALTYLSNGAQPSERVANLLKAEGVKLPKWVAKATKKSKSTKNLEKLRKNRPAEPETAESKDEPATPDASPSEQASAPAAEESEAVAAEVAEQPTDSPDAKE